MPWLTGWGYRKSHVINFAAGAGTFYQKRVIVHYGSGADSGEDVYLNSKSRTDFGDVRFTDDDGITLLDCWMESKVDGNYAIFWVEVADSLSTENVTIYVYYGKSDAVYPYLASALAHGEATFALFDDFEDNSISSAKWVDGAAKNYVMENSGIFATLGDAAITLAETGGQLKISGTCSVDTGIEDGVLVGWIGKGLRSVTTFDLSGTRRYAIESSVTLVTSTMQFPGGGVMCHGVGFALDKDNRFDGFWGGESVNWGVKYQKEEGGVRSGALLQALGLPALPVTKRHVYKTWGPNNYDYHIPEGGSTTSTFASATARLALFAAPRYVNDVMDVRFEWVFVRNFVSPEPAHGAWGSEETPPPPGPPPVGPPKIELRLTSVDPPAPDPPRTIYRDLVNLPDPVQLGLTMRYFNYDDVTLYFRITGSCAGYTFGSVDLGSLGSGLSAYRNLDNFASRAKPAVELTESIKLILRAYTDAGYTNLKWTYERIVSVVWIDSSDPGYTVDVLNDFDDGTVQGWSAAAEAGCTVSLTVAADYALSPPYSLRNTVTGTIPGGGQTRARVAKSFTTPNRDIVYAIIDMRVATGAGQLIKNYQVQRDATVLIFIGRPYDTTGVDYAPLNKWIRIVVPLPKNTTLDLRLVQEGFCGLGTAWQFWMDDFKIISK